MLAGRDLRAGGTWMGVSRSGRFAAVTNFRGAREPSAPESRGALVTQFLAREQDARAYVTELEPRAAHFSGFNLLVSDGRALWSMSNRGGPVRELPPGLYGLGNALLDDPAVDGAKAAFAGAALQAPGVEPLLSVLAKWRIVDSVYGTRCSTVWRHTPGGRSRYAERSFGPEGADGETVSFDFPAG